ncbi:hypothetical protein VNO78_03724 [Psophocarpus tetragonolobus]|uniref:F-box domain-containing protein n=1 Tax=Psophocarpus tetragonolobus TaxID=3891 RepID=A0AAN9T0W0_PSOTE
MPQIPTPVSLGLVEASAVLSPTHSFLTLDSNTRLSTIAFHPLRQQPTRGNSTCIGHHRLLLLAACSLSTLNAFGNMAIPLDSYCYTLTLGRKRVVVSNDVETSPQVTTPFKRMCSKKISPNSERSLLEALPQDILVKVLCGVDHEDLKQLFHVSRTIREATLIAKELHFEYSTPKKRSLTFLNRFDLENANGLKEIQAPNAPLRKSKSRLNGKKLADISLALFSFMDEEETE